MASVNSPRIVTRLPDMDDVVGRAVGTKADELKLGEKLVFDNVSQGEFNNSEIRRTESGFEFWGDGAKMLEMDGTGTITVLEALIPSPTDAVDLGSEFVRWGSAFFAGVVDAGSFVGDGSSLTGVATPAQVALKENKFRADIRDYGAVADGETDNTAAFVAAATAAYAAGHCTVYVPAGVWGVAGVLGTNFFSRVPNAALTIIGDEGIDSTLVVNNNTSLGPVSVIKALDQQTLFEMSGATRNFSSTQFRNLRLDGNDPAHVGDGRGVWIHNHQGQICDLIFDGVWIDDFAYEGIRHGNDSEAEPITNPATNIMWKSLFHRVQVSRCGRDSIRLCNTGTYCEISDFAMLFPAPNYVGIRVFGGEYTQCMFKGGHIGNSVGVDVGGGMILDGGGRYTFEGVSFEGWKGAGVDIRNAACCIFTECFWLDVVGGGTQTIIRYENGNPAYSIFMFDPTWQTSGAGWKNGNPIEHTNVSPLIFLFSALDRTMTSRYTGNGAVTQIKPIISGTWGSDRLPRFTSVIIDKQPELVLSRYDSVPIVRVWAETAPDTNYVNADPHNSGAHTDGDTIITNAAGAATGVAMYRRVGGVWKVVPFNDSVAVLAAANTYTISPQQITVNNQNNKGLIVKAAAAQIANLLEVQNSTGTPIFAVDSAGRVGAGAVPNATYFLDVNTGAAAAKMRLVSTAADAQFSLSGSSFGQIENGAGAFYITNSGAGQPINFRTDGGALRFVVGSAQVSSEVAFLIKGNVGFYNTAPVAKPAVAGSRGANAALTSLLTALASQGLVTDNTTA
jgi:hypothetical protein